MIPVRVPADATTHIVRSGFTIGESHPLYGVDCPVCDTYLADGSVSLVYVGTHPTDREGAYWTGGAVAVHDACAGVPATPSGEDPNSD